jgi:hypothetical protein
VLWRLDSFAKTVRAPCINLRVSQPHVEVIWVRLLRLTAGDMKMAIFTKRVLWIGLVATLICAGTVVRFVPTSFERAYGQESPRAEGIDYSVGSGIQLRQVDFSKANHTLLVFVTTNCQYCVESVPVFRTIIEDPSHRRGDFRVVLVGLEPTEPLRRFQTSYKLLPDQVVTISPREARIRTTPTIIVVDRDAIVRRILIGQQTSPRLKNLLSDLSRNAT